MSPSLPVWPTTKAVLAYTWQHRALAFRYAAVPVLLLVALDAAGMAAGIPMDDNYWQIGTTIVSFIAFAPLAVTWYLAIVDTNGTAERRPWFTFGGREGAVVMTNVLIALVISVAALPMVGIVGLIAALVYQINPLAGQAIAVILAIPAVFFWLMLLTRLSVAIAFAAVGRHIGLRETWRLTKPVGVPMTLTHIILGLIGMGIAAAVVALVGAGTEAAGFGGEGSPVTDLAVSVADTVFGIIYLLLATTLFGFIYRQLAPPQTET